MAREAGAGAPTVAVAAGSFEGEPDEGVLAVQLEDLADTREQLVRAGARIAVAYLNDGAAGTDAGDAAE